jgi:hypothetical protein
MREISQSRFRAGDKVVIESRGEFYAYVDGWVGRVVAVGPKQPNACHSQIPEGYILVEIDRGGDTPLQLPVPYDHLRLTV